MALAMANIIIVNVDQVWPISRTRSSCQIKKVKFVSKVLLDPADFQKDLPKIKLP